MELEDFWYIISMYYVDETDDTISYHYLIDSEDIEDAGLIKFNKDLNMKAKNDSDLLDAFIEGEAEIIKICQSKSVRTNDDFDMLAWMALVLIMDEHERLGFYPEDAGFLNIKNEDVVQQNSEMISRILSKKSNDKNTSPS